MNNVNQYRRTRTVRPDAARAAMNLQGRKSNRCKSTGPEQGTLGCSLSMWTPSTVKRHSSINYSGAARKVATRCYRLSHRNGEGPEAH
eukprot:1157123-Pelagomonas_calceolata.AAC.7